MHELESLAYPHWIHDMCCVWILIHFHVSIPRTNSWPKQKTCPRGSPRQLVMRAPTGFGLPRKSMVIRGILRALTLYYRTLSSTPLRPSHFSSDNPIRSPSSRDSPVRSVVASSSVVLRRQNEFSDESEDQNAENDAEDRATNENGEAQRYLTAHNRTLQAPLQAADVLEETSRIGDRLSDEGMRLTHINPDCEQDFIRRHAGRIDSITWTPYS